MTPPDALPRELIKAVENGAHVEDRGCPWCRGSGTVYHWGHQREKKPLGDCPLCGGCGRIYVLRGPEEEG